MGPVAARRVDHDRPQTHALTRRRESLKKESGGAKCPALHPSRGKFWRGSQWKTGNALNRRREADQKEENQPIWRQ